MIHCRLKKEEIKYDDFVKKTTILTRRVVREAMKQLLSCSRSNNRRSSTEFAVDSNICERKPLEIVIYVPTIADISLVLPQDVDQFQKKDTRACKVTLIQSIRDDSNQSQSVSTKTRAERMPNVDIEGTHLTNDHNFDAAAACCYASTSQKFPKKIEENFKVITRFFSDHNML